MRIKRQDYEDGIAVMFSTTMESMQEVIIEQKFDAKRSALYIVGTILVTIERNNTSNGWVTIGDIFDIMERRPKATTEMLTDFLSLWERGKITVKADYPFTYEETRVALLGEERKDVQK